jgi:hypothetical protein
MVPPPDFPALAPTSVINKLTKRNGKFNLKKMFNIEIGGSTHADRYYLG